MVVPRLPLCGTLTQRNAREIRVSGQELLQRNRSYCTAGIDPGAMMRSYSDEELDVMAEAYNRLLSRMPHEFAAADIKLRLVEEIGAGVANGVRDEDALAEAALARASLDELQ
jgi:hypothetical protein